MPALPELPAVVERLSPEALPAVPFRTALRLWAKVAILSFGGPAGQVAVFRFKLGMLLRDSAMPFWGSGTGEGWVGV